MDTGTLISLTALVSTFIYFLLKERRTGLSTVVEQFEKRLDDMEIPKIRASLTELSEKLVAIDAMMSVMTTSIQAYQNWLMEGGLQKLINRIDTNDAKFDTLFEVVNSYMRFSEVAVGLKHPPNIYIVEDCEEDALLLKRYFSEAGVSGILGVAETIQQAISFLDDPSTELPDMVFLDLRLPDGSGEKILSYIRSNQLLSHISVIVTTGMDADSISPTITELADLVVTKPVNVGLFMKKYRQGLKWDGREQ